MIPGLQALHKLTQGSPEITVAILDGVVDTQHREQVKAEEQINYLTKASIGYGIEKRVGKRQK
ncbi:MAG: hypothetical protein IM319_11445 [Microcystis sp. M113S1]|uniref:hypothetical protein n=1 Tax=Microcystis sp. M113S1 TaxID=2771104 RepID=UPI00258CDF4D|nr:hypothetical protein [Microcystis sp. M113S1]MCA2939734.1 hypothetical protein [Microcystis sp. M113S1]